MNALFRTLFGKPQGEAQATVPPGTRVYAVGDVHGRADLLDEILLAIDSDDRGRGRARTLIVFLGDLIDRGPESAEVIARLRSYRRVGTRTIHLCGNHEEILLRLLGGDSSYLDDWLRFGGAECAASYGLEPELLKGLKPADAIARIKDAIPREHQRFFRAMADTFSVGGYLFVHAGVRPGVPLAEQSQVDLRWIRQPFLECEHPHGFVVVHGHTISEQVEFLSNRIGIDTGAYRTGVLTALGMENDRRWLLQTGQADQAVEHARSSAAD